MCIERWILVGAASFPASSSTVDVPLGKRTHQLHSIGFWLFIFNFILILILVLLSNLVQIDNWIDYLLRILRSIGAWCSLIRSMIVIWEMLIDII